MSVCLDGGGFVGESNLKGDKWFVGQLVSFTRRVDGVLVGVASGIGVSWGYVFLYKSWGRFACHCLLIFLRGS